MLQKIGIAVAVFLLLLVGAGWFALAKHSGGVRAATEAWESHRPEPIGEIGTTSSLTIIPLVDWHAAEENLQSDMGVSYLVKTDDKTILFDTGNDSTPETPHPLTENMAALGVSLDQIDTVVISHAHFDHIGGREWSDGAITGTTFGIGHEQPDLSGIEVVTPVEMTYPGVEPTVGTDPVRIGDGVATTGTIPRKLVIGWIDEQALAVNVEGKGLVLIVGCGHQTLARLIERTERVFDVPIHGVVGGLHYPVPEGRITKLGINVQRRLASGDGPFAPLTQDEVDRELSLLEEREVGVVGIGGHDSSDAVIADAAARFPDAYRYVKVGEPIVID